MDFEAFQSMTNAEAVEYLSSLLATERPIVDDISKAAREKGVNFDYTLETLPECLKWLMRQMRMTAVPLPPDIPDWIRSTQPQGLSEFDDESKSLILRGGYYLGECFARRPGLSWAIGNPKFMFCNMPVITGFQNDQELPPLLVFENLCARVLERNQPNSVFDSVIDNWRQSMNAGASSG